MSTLRSLINERIKEPTAIVRFNGIRTRDILSIDINTVLEDSIADASLSMLSNPGITPEAKVTIEQGYNGKNKLTFTGYVDSIDYDEYEETYAVSCRDVLKKAVDTYFIQEIKFGLDVDSGIYYYSTYSTISGGTFYVHEYASLGALNAGHPETTGNYTGEGVKAEAVVQWILVMCGFAEGTEIQVEDTNFFIGDITPIKFFLTNAYDAIMQIAQLIGWRLYADQAGVVRFRKRPRNYSGFSQWRYSTQSSQNAMRVKRNVSNVDLRNYVEVRGASGIVSIKRGPSDYIGSTPYRGALISNELIDTQDIADYMAARVYNDLNRLKTSVSVEADGNPYIVPGDTIEIRSRVASSNYLVTNHGTTMSSDGYFSNIEAAAFTGDVEIEDEPPATIVAAFVPAEVAVLGDPKYVVKFDGSSSYSSRGQITTWSWSFPDSSTATEYDPQVWYVFDEADISNGNSQVVVLSVFDEFGNTASVSGVITQSLLVSGQSVKYRHLYGALTTFGAGSDDGGLTWNTIPVNAISVAASNFAAGGVATTSGYALFGTSDGTIHRTVDVAKTSTVVLSAGSDVTAVSIPELNSSYAVAGTENGRVYLSFNGGVSWSLKYTFGFAIREVRFGYTDYQYLLVVGEGVGNTYQSFDQGASWTKIGGSLLTLDVLHETSGAFTNYYTHSGGVEGVLNGTPTALAFSGGSNPYVPAGTVAVDNDAGVMIVDSTGQHWNLSSASGQFNPTQYNPTNKTEFMIRDGDLIPVIYYATQSGISKSLDRNQTIQELYWPAGAAPGTGWGKQVAYGPLAPKLASGIFVGFTGNNGVINSSYMASGQSGSDGIFMFSPVDQKWWRLSDRSAGPGTPSFDFDVSDNMALQASGYAFGYILFTSASGNAQTWNHNVWATPEEFHTDPGQGFGLIRWASMSRKAATRFNVSIAYQEVANRKLSTIKNVTTDPEEGAYVMNPYGFQTWNSVKLSSTDRTAGIILGGGSQAIYEADFNVEPPTLEQMTIVSDGGDYTALDPVTNFTSRYWTLFRASTTDFRTESVAAPLPYDGPEFLRTLGTNSVGGNRGAHASYVVKGNLYYINPTDTALYRVNQYGLGTSELLLTLPSGYSTVAFTINSDLRNTVDYLCLTLNQDATDMYTVRYSDDSGVTWIEGPTVQVNNAPITLWRVVPHT